MRLGQSTHKYTWEVSKDFSRLVRILAKGTSRCFDSHSGCHDLHSLPGDDNWARGRLLYFLYILSLLLLHKSQLFCSQIYTLQVSFAKQCERNVRHSFRRVCGIYRSFADHLVIALDTAGKTRAENRIKSIKKRARSEHWGRDLQWRLPQRPPVNYNIHIGIQFSSLFNFIYTSDAHQQHHYHHKRMRARKLVIWTVSINLTTTSDDGDTPATNTAGNACETIQFWWAFHEWWFACWSCYRTT